MTAPRGTGSPVAVGLGDGVLVPLGEGEGAVDVGDVGSVGVEGLDAAGASSGAVLAQAASTSEIRTAAKHRT